VAFVVNDVIVAFENQAVQVSGSYACLSLGYLETWHLHCDGYFLVSLFFLTCFAIKLAPQIPGVVIDLVAGKESQLCDGKLGVSYRKRVLNSDDLPDAVLEYRQTCRIFRECSREIRWERRERHSSKCLGCTVHHAKLAPTGRS
jgi:hypothetical protein